VFSSYFLGIDATFPTKEMCTKLGMVQSGLRSSTGECRVKKSATKPADYIESLPLEVRVDIDRLDTAITKIMSGHVKTMWEGKLWGGSDQRIIGYGDYSYERSNGHAVEWFIVGLALQKRYISVYVNAVDDDGYLVEKYADKLGKVKVGKSSISFHSLEDINLDVLEDLVAKANKLMSRPRS
jgi:hypothetical protein